MKHFQILTALALGFVLVLTGKAQELSAAKEKEIIQQVEKTTQAIRAAYEAGDVEGAMKYHHPEAQKTIHYSIYQDSRDKVEQGLDQVARANELEFIFEGKPERYIVSKDMVVMQSKFTIELDPKNGGQKHVADRRILAVYVKSKMSPTGWARIHEIIQFP